MHKQKILYCMIILLTIFLSACSQNEQVDPREKEIVQLLNDKKHDEAIQKANELYKNDDKLVEVLNYIKEDQERELTRKQMIEEVYPSTKLEIQSEHTGKIQDNYYYITGRVKNISNKNIDYFEVQCNFLDDNNQVLDSDYVNDNLVLKPGEMREFEIMHRYKDEYEKYQLSIGDVI